MNLLLPDWIVHYNWLTTRIVIRSQFCSCFWLIHRLWFLHWKKKKTQINVQPHLWIAPFHLVLWPGWSLVWINHWAQAVSMKSSNMCPHLYQVRGLCYLEGSLKPSELQFVSGHHSIVHNISCPLLLSQTLWSRHHWTNQRWSSNFGGVVVLETKRGKPFQCGSSPSGTSGASSGQLSTADPGVSRYDGRLLRWPVCMGVYLALKEQLL